MAPETFVDLVGALRYSFFVLPTAEIAVEIDPRTLTRAMIEALALGGVNRASLGVQSFDPAVQRAINRMQSFEQTAAAISGLRRAGVVGINFDLIYGLPHQTVASCLDTVARMRRAAAGPLLGVRLRARAVVQEAPAQDPKTRGCPTASSGSTSPVRSRTR